MPLQPRNDLISRRMVTRIPTDEAVALVASARDDKDTTLLPRVAGDGGLSRANRAHDCCPPDCSV